MCYGHPNMSLTTMSRWWPRLGFHHITNCPAQLMRAWMSLCAAQSDVQLTQNLGWVYEPSRCEPGLSLWAIQMRTWFEPVCHPHGHTEQRWACLWRDNCHVVTSFFPGRWYKPGNVFLQTCVRPWHRLSTDVSKTIAVSFYRHLHQFCWHRHLYGWIYSRSMISEICWYNNHSNMQSQLSHVTPHLWVA
jgi:hypothetical protein